jgi:hypothetical protein
MSDKVTAHVPMHLLYELVEEAGELRVERLAAHWELWPMIKQLLSKGTACVPVLNALGIRMLSIQGAGGAIGFMKGFRGIGTRGKDAVITFTQALNKKELSVMVGLFGGINHGIHFPYASEHYTPDELVELDVKLSVKKLLAAGYTVSCSVEVEREGNIYHGVGLFEFNSKSKKLDTVRLYWDDAED